MKHYLFNYSKKRKYLLFIGDLFVLMVALLMTYCIRVYLTVKHPSLNIVFSKITPWLIPVMLFHVTTLYLLDQYNLNRLVYRFRSAVMIVMSVLLAGLMIGAVFFFFPKYIFGRQVLLIHLIVTSFLLAFWRFIFYELMVKKEKYKKLALMGSGANLEKFISDVLSQPNIGFEISSVCLNESSDEVVSQIPAEVYVCNSIDELLSYGNFDVLVFDTSKCTFADIDVRRIMQAKYQGKMIFDLPTFYKNLTGKLPLLYLDGKWLLSREGLQGEVSKIYIHVKRLLDILLSFFLIGIFSPLFLVFALAIKLDSRGPVFFIQERLGRYRHIFPCIKFRTMVADAEKTTGPVWASGYDPRITRIGKVLRKTRLDELPQLFNILRGELSFVGPRPIREYFANPLAEKIPFYELRFSVQPGLSGWAQVNYDYAGSEEGQLEKFQYELFYIQNMSIFLDIMVIFKTTQTVFKGGGA